MKTQSLLWSFALICLGCIASQAQEYEYVPIVRENVRYTFSDGQTMTILPDNRYVNGQLYAYAYMPDFSYRAKILIFLREENKVVYQVDVNRYGSPEIRNSHLRLQCRAGWRYHVGLAQRPALFRHGGRVD